MEKKIKNRTPSVQKNIGLNSPIHDATGILFMLTIKGEVYPDWF